MARYAAARLAALVPVLLVVGISVFLLIHLIPGDPAAVMLGGDASPAQVAQLRHALGLDRPIYVQLILWFERVLHGDLGNSIFLRQPVARAIWDHLGPTAGLTALAEGLALAAAIPSGMLAAWKQHSRFDQAFMIVVLLGVSMPSFWTGLNLIAVFAVTMRLLPVAGYVSPTHGFGPWAASLLLPAVALAFTQAGLIARMARDATIEVLGEDYIRTARSKGLAGFAVVVRHALRNGLIPVVTILGLQMGALMSGAVVTESIFVVPGFGRLIVEAVFTRDYPLVQGVVLITASSYVLINLLVDVSYSFLNPRIRIRGRP